MCKKLLCHRRLRRRNKYVHSAEVVPWQMFVATYVGMSIRKKNLSDTAYTLFPHHHHHDNHRLSTSSMPTLKRGGGGSAVAALSVIAVAAWRRRGSALMFADSF